MQYRRVRVFLHVENVTFSQRPYNFTPAESWQATGKGQPDICASFGVRVDCRRLALVRGPDCEIRAGISLSAGNCDTRLPPRPRIRLLSRPKRRANRIADAVSAPRRDVISLISISLISRFPFREESPVAIGSIADILPLAECRIARNRACVVTLAERKTGDVAKPRYAVE